MYSASKLMTRDIALAWVSSLLIIVASTFVSLKYMFMDCFTSRKGGGHLLGSARLFGTIWYISVYIYIYIYIYIYHYYMQLMFTADVRCWWAIHLHVPCVWWTRHLSTLQLLRLVRGRPTGTYCRHRLGKSLRRMSNIFCWRNFMRNFMHIVV